MSTNTEILNAQAEIHNLQCLISVLKRLFQSPENMLEFTANEIEGMLDQFDDMADRLERLHAKMETLLQENPSFSVVNDGGNAGNILAILTATNSKRKVSTIPRNGNGNGTRKRNTKLRAVPNLVA